MSALPPSRGVTPGNRKAAAPCLWAVLWPPKRTAQSMPVFLTGLTAGPSGALLYSLETDTVSGIFLLDSQGIETRLFIPGFSRSSCRASPGWRDTGCYSVPQGRDAFQYCCHPVHGTDSGRGHRRRSLRSDAALDSGGKRRIVFQSAGIGRDASGRFAGLGPCAIQQLDLDSGDLDELASESGRDLLRPRQTENGSLYYIRKPYESGIPDASIIASLKDAALFPFRMGRAVFQYFNVFSMMYTGKPLMSGRRGPKKMDPRQLFIYGNLARAQMAQSSRTTLRIASPHPGS